MKQIRLLALAALAADVRLFVTDSGSYAQRGGRGGGGGGALRGRRRRARPARAAAAAARGGSARTGAAVGPYGGAGGAQRTASTVVGPQRVPVPPAAVAVPTPRTVAQRSAPGARAGRPPDRAAGRPAPA